MKNRLQFWSIAALAIALVSLTSPKWNYGPAAWVAATPLLLLLNRFNPGKSILISWSILFLSGLIAQYKVMPFPVIIYIIMVAWTSLLATIPYLLYRLLTRNSNGWLATLAFPILSVTLEYLTSFQGGGTWGSSAYTQMNQLEFIQLASITGIWGITFMIKWFSSLMAWMISQRFELTMVSKPASIYGLLVIAITLYGSARLNPYFKETTETVRVSGISRLNLEPVQIMYEEAFGKSLEINLSSLSQTSPQLQELNKGLVSWVETSATKGFPRTKDVLANLNDQLFFEAKRTADAGAKIISFAEAQMITMKSAEGDIIKRGRQFAKDNRVYLILSLASFFPEKIEFGKPFYENKLVLIDDHGSIAHQFYKNKPVPLVEGAKPGDGTVPVLATRYGQMALSICYDGDFPQLIRQAGKKGADMLFLPSGDWKEISPYHADMARMRAIENGFALIRPVSNASTVACDNMGSPIAIQEFSPTRINTMIVDLPVKHINTIYNIISDAVAVLCLGITVILVVMSVSNFLSPQRRKGR